MANKGTDVIGKIIAATTNFGADLEQLRTAQAPNILSRAVVTEVLNDLSIYTPEEFDDLGDRLSNADDLFTCPRNSIFVKVVTGGQAKRTAKELLCYPFFPPYLCFPVKAGEQVWLITENPQFTIGPGYWMCRIPEPNFVDDLNYTHGDRKLGVGAALSTSERASGDPKPDPKPHFINGAGDPDDFTLSDLEAYEDIVYSSVSYTDFTPDPVPRFTKRAADLALQGSNNTLICLGEDRGGIALSVADSNTSNATKGADEMLGLRNLNGTIDIVAGRGRDLPAAETEEPALTAPRVITNTRDYLEVDKNPVITGIEVAANRLDNPTEGDPDFSTDAARIYVSMRTEGDKNFGLTYANADATDAGDKAYVILKSDEIRIVSREGGSIRLVKEGENQCEVSMLSNGNLAIEASKIFLGEHPDGPETEPVMMGAKLEAALHAYADGVSSTITGLIGNLGAPLIANAAIAGPTAAFKAAVTEALSQTTFTK